MFFLQKLSNRAFSTWQLTPSSNPQKSSHPLPSRIQPANRRKMSIQSLDPSSSTENPYWGSQTPKYHGKDLLPYGYGDFTWSERDQAFIHDRGSPSTMRHREPRYASAHHPPSSSSLNYTRRPENDHRLPTTRGKHRYESV